MLEKLFCLGIFGGDFEEILFPPILDIGRDLQL